MFHVLSRGRQCEFSGHTNPCCWATAEQLLYPHCGCSTESVQKWMQLAQHTWSAVPKTTRSSPCSSKEAKSGIHLVNVKPAQNNPVTLCSHPQHLFRSQHLQSPRSGHAAECSQSRNDGSGLFMAMCPVHDSDAHKHMKYKKKCPRSFHVTWLPVPSPRPQKESSTGLLHPSTAFSYFVYKNHFQMHL